MSAAPRDRAQPGLDDALVRAAGVDVPVADLHIRGVRIASVARIAVLGPLRIGGVHPRITPRDRVVLEALSIRAGDNVTTDWLADALWGESPPASAAKNLQGCIARLRKVLGHHAIETTASGYRLAVPPTDVDSHAFEQLVLRGRELMSLREPDRAAYVLDQALALFTGEPLEDLARWDLGVLEAERLREVRLGAEELRVDAFLAAGQHQEALPKARALMTQQPLRERRHVQLALAQYRSGEQAAALATLRQLRQRLLDELGVDPGPEATALEQAVLLQDSDLMVAAASGQGTTCPCPGLTSYELEDRETFCGRDTETAACLRLLLDRGVVSVVGPSGSGKSSLLRAGIAASLRAAGREVSVVSPGRAGPSEADAVARTPIRTVLLVDQLEEAFAPAVTPEHRAAYLDALTRRGGGGELVVTLRADRTPDLSAEPELARLLERGWYLLNAMDAAGLRTAIERPARQAGLLVEPGLVDLLVREVLDEPGALPLLSHSLVETWNRREGRTLTVDGYVATGGVRGSIAQSAEAVYHDVPPEQRDQFRDLLMRLVAPGPEGEPTRIRISRDRVVTRPEQERLVELLVGSRLLTTDDGNITLAHEALAREWPRLRGWLADDVEGQRILRHVSASADAWQAMGRPDSELYRGVRLARLLEWHTGSATELAPVERSFLDESLRLRSAEERTAAEQMAAQARTNRRLRGVLTGAVLLLALALVAGGIAAIQSDRANENAEKASQSAISALARGAAARGTASGDLDTELLLAAAGVVLDESPETVGNLQQIISEHDALIRSSPLGGPQAVALDIYPDGRTAALYDSAHALSILDLSTGAEKARRQIGTTRSEYDTRRVLQVSPDGSMIAVGAAPFSDRLLYLLDAQSLQQVSPQPTGLPRGNWKMMDAEFSQDGSTLVAVVSRLTRDDAAWTATATRAYVWSLTSPAEPVAVVDLSRWTSGERWASAALSPDGRLLYTATPTVRVHDLASGGVRTLSVQGTTDFEVGFEVSPDGRLLILARGDLGTDAVLLDADTGRVRHTLRHDNETFDARFSSDGRRVLTVTYQPNIANVWDTRTGRRITRFALPAGEPSAVDLDGVRDRVVSSTDQSLRFWDVGGSRRYLRREPITGMPTLRKFAGSCFVNPSSDGAYVAYTMCDGSAFIVDVIGRGAFPEHPTSSGYGFGGGSWNIGRAEYVRALGGTLDIWDGRTGQVRAGPHPVGDLVSEVGHSPDGSRVVISELAGTLTLLDGATLEPVGRPVDLGANVCCVALGPDNRTSFALVGGPERSNLWNEPADRWALVDLESGTVVKQGALGLGSANWATWSPDGRHVAATGLDGVAIIDTETGELVREPIKAHGEVAVWAVFSEDGSRLVSGGGNGTVILWDAETGAITGRVTLPGEPPTSPTFLPNGDIMIVPWSTEAAVYIWDPSPKRAVESACRAAGRDVTETEWAEHFPGQPFRSVCPQS